jgi:oxygen-independent coproporphyrinogen-3 oxidase
MLGVYLHLPFCAGKCPYCGFNSRPADASVIEYYLAALHKEIGLRSQDDVAADTVYFGGGTPTILPPSRLADILQAALTGFRAVAGAEVTVEANPESLTREALAELRQAGFNRLSIGAQSFDDGVLAALGRRHDAARAVQAVRDARATGWSNISLDLIFAVPGQSLGQWSATLEQAIGLRPEHISTYCLSIEPESEFERRKQAGEIEEVGEEAELEMYAAARLMLRAAGYEHYEISNFALPGKRCRHNEKYWRGGEYVGLGAGAHSRVGGVRWANAARTQEYVAMLAQGAFPVTYAERLSARRALEEELILALRTSEGACLRELGARCGRDGVSECRNQLKQLAAAGLAAIRGSRVSLTDQGMALANEVAIRIMA